MLLNYINITRASFPERCFDANLSFTDTKIEKNEKVRRFCKLIHSFDPTAYFLFEVEMLKIMLCISHAAPRLLYFLQTKYLALCF